MTIDINDLREKITIKGLDVVADTDILEILDRLEAAEKDVALKEQVIDALGSELNAVANERDALRAKIERMEQQEPVATIHINSITGNPSVYFIPGHRYLHHNSSLYALPGAQTQLNEIKIALQRALELGQRETWTGARKHRSWEDQREEQQCWNKVWSLLGAKGEEK